MNSQLEDIIHQSQGKSKYYQIYGKNRTMKIIKYQFQYLQEEQVSDEGGVIQKNNLIFDEKEVQKTIYALKEIGKKVIRQNKLTTQIQNEIQIMYKQKDHKNILKLYTHLEDAFNIYLVTEFVDGWNLNQLPFIQVLDTKVKWDIICQLAQGVKCLHDSQVIHRDLKPSNILISSKNTVKISNFSWSNYFPQQNRKRMTRLINDENQFNPFVPPEIRVKVGHSEKVDIWCLGMLIYFILTDASLPFGIPSNSKLVDSKLAEQLELNIRQNSFQFDPQLQKISSNIIPLLENMLQKDPSQRFTISEVLGQPFFQEPIQQHALFGDNKQPSAIDFNQSEDQPKTLPEIKNIMRITIADLLSVNDVPNNNDKRNSGINIKNDNQDVSKIRRTIKAEQEAFLAVDQIKQIIPSSEIDEKCSFPPSIFQQKSYSQQKHYLETEYFDDFQRKMDEQIAYIIHQEDLKKEEALLEKRKHIEMQFALDSLTSSMNTMLNQENSLTAKDDALFKNKLKILKLEEDNINCIDQQNAGEMNKESDECSNSICNQFDFDQSQQFNKKDSVVLKGKNNLETIRQSGGENIEIDEICVFPLNNVMQSLSEMDISYAVPLIGLQDSSTNSNEKDQQTEFKNHMIEDSESHQKDIIQKVNSQMIEVQIEDQAGIDNGLKNSQVFLEEIRGCIQQGNMLKSNKKKLLEYLREGGRVANDVLQEKLTIIMKEREELMRNIKENEKDMEKLKCFYLMNKDFRVNQLETPLSLKTILTASEVDKCRTLEYIKYENSQTISELDGVKKEKYAIIEQQQKEVQNITVKWSEVQLKRNQLIELQTNISKQEEAIQFINSREQALKLQILKYNTFKDLELLKDSIIMQRDSFHGISDSKVEESALKEIVNKISTLNKNPLIRSTITLHSSAKERISKLNDQEYLLKQVNQFISKQSHLTNNISNYNQDMIYGVSKIDEETKTEYEKKKIAEHRLYLKRKEEQDNKFQKKIEELESNIRSVKMNDIPVQELEIARANKKHLDSEITILETWLQKNSKHIR